MAKPATIIDYTKPIVGFDDVAFVDNKGEPMTLLSAVFALCSLPARGDDTLTPMDLFAIGEIGATVKKGLPLTVEQRSRLKSRCPLVFNSPALIYILQEALEGR